jgi:NAD+ kinase
LKIGIFVKVDRLDFATRLREIITWMNDRGCDLLVERRAAQLFGLSTPSAEREQIPALVDLIIVFGGDGTLLSVARLGEQKRAPILGANLGSLGFLTGVTLEELYPALDQILKGLYSIDRRSMVKAVIRKKNGNAQEHHAFNDVVVNKGTLARMISLEVWIDNQFTSRFLADGMIISTPTGSTAYSLSAGGPIVYPTLNSLSLTPICPHTLNHRPLIIPDKSEVRVVLQGGDEAALTIDGQIGVALGIGDEIFCTRSQYQVELVQPTGRSFFEVLRQKLKWGER